MTDVEPTITREQADALRAEFPKEHVGLLPKITCGICSKAPGRCCDKHNKAKCKDCGNWITSAHIHLDYVGHGAVTDRLLVVDPLWSWEPLAFDGAGMPTFVYDGNSPVTLWIRLTVLGVTRLGVGSCPSNQGDAEKVLIGDALRNAAMRFGVGLDLWIKGQAEDSEQHSATSTRSRDQRSRTQQAPADGGMAPPAEETYAAPPPAVSRVDVAKLAEAAFQAQYDDAPQGKKTKVRDRLRHAVIYAATKGRTASLADCTDVDLAAIKQRLDAIVAGQITVTAEPLDDGAGVTFATAAGERTVLWAEVEMARGEDEAVPA